MEHRRRLFLLALCWLPFTLSAAELRFSSAATAPAVIELFTSEGCNSCPPAEDWLNAMVDHPQLWRRVIPLAFHVDYWDYLGWKDPYADARHSQRQRRYAGLGKLSTVYTPAFVVDGREWRRRWWRDGPPAGAPRGGVLTAQLKEQTVSAQLDRPAQPLVLNVALLGMGLVTDIAAGENRGRRSRHEFVVLGWNRSNARRDGWQVPLPKPRAAPTRYALAVWLSSSEDPTPLYALGGYLPEEWRPPAAASP